jgi:hypothetical protein
LNFYSENPLDINIASEEELSQLGLSVFQVSALLAHRKRFGLLESVYELQAVQGFDLNSIYAILPFIKVEPKSFLSTFSINKFLKESKKQVLLRIQRVLEPDLPPLLVISTKYTCAFGCNTVIKFVWALLVKRTREKHL